MRFGFLYIYIIYYTMPNTTVQPEKKPAFARQSGTTTSATAPAPKRNTITDSSTASDRCMCSSLEFSRLRSNKSSLKLYKDERSLLLAP